MPCSSRLAHLPSYATQDHRPGGGTNPHRARFSHIHHWSRKCPIHLAEGQSAMETTPPLAPLLPDYSSLCHIDQKLTSASHSQAFPPAAIKAASHQRLSLPYLTSPRGLRYLLPFMMRAWEWLLSGHQTQDSRLSSWLPVVHLPSPPGLSPVRRQHALALRRHQKSRAKFYLNSFLLHSKQLRYQVTLRVMKYSSLIELKRRLS